MSTKRSAVNGAELFEGACTDRWQMCNLRYIKNACSSF